MNLKHDKTSYNDSIQHHIQLDSLCKKIIIQCIEVKLKIIKYKLVKLKIIA